MASERSQYRKYNRNNVTSLNIHKFSTQSCGYKGYKCPLLCIEGYGFCIRHVLEDEFAPFEQCCYTYPYSMKKCPLPAPKNDFSGSYCPEHYNRIKKNRFRNAKPQPPVTAELLLSNLAHFVQNPRKKVRLSESEEVDVENVQHSVNPFVDINAIAVNAAQSNILEYCSESDSDVDSTVIARTTRCKDEDSSDAESIDSAEEDPLKFASVFTSSEVIIRAKEKTERLKSLYTEQLGRLVHVLQERRRDYIANIQKEKEVNCSIAEQAKTTVREQILAEKVKQYNHYRKRYGVEALLRKKVIDKRNKAISESNGPGRVTSKCIYTEGGVKCCVRTLPSLRYCLKHVLEDQTQVLFRPCGFIQGDDVCREPLPGMEPCLYHLDIPPQQLQYHTAFSSGEEDESKEDVKDEPITVPIKSEVLEDDLNDLSCGIKEEEVYEEQVIEEQQDIFGEEMEIVDGGVIGCEEEIVYEEIQMAPTDH